MTDWRPLLAVAAGAAIGGVLRFLVATVTVERLGSGSGWLATGAINVSGSLLIGIVVELAAHGHVSPLGRLFLATGILGGYTTFSTYALEVALAAPGSAALDWAYGAGSLVVGVGAAALGVQLTRLALR